jgi:hypothetical protein
MRQLDWFGFDNQGAPEPLTDTPLSEGETSSAIRKDIDGDEHKHNQRPQHRPKISGSLKESSCWISFYGMPPA